MDEPAEWCARMVVVPKANGKVQIYIYLTKLNKSIQTELRFLGMVNLLSKLQSQIAELSKPLRGLLS